MKNEEKTKEFIKTGKRVIEKEARALDLLEKSIEESLSKAVETILRAKGRVIVSGMGKSGHIARKIAATLASTGTPSHFLHPGEASHGDLGMITSGDVAILLSNSGETPELANVISYLHRFKIPLIGVAGNSSSSLLKNSDIPNFLAISDILLIPYDTDFTIKGGSKALEYSSPIKLFEYLSSGKPIIASNLPSISRILSDGSDSILVNPDSFNDLNTALSSLLASKELSSRISEKSLKLSRQFTWVGRAKRMLLPKN